MPKEKKRSFFERLTGGVRLHDEDEEPKSTRIMAKLDEPSGDDPWT